MEGIFKRVDKIKPLYDVTYKVMLFICKVLLVADILITVYSITGRYVSFIPDSAWTEQMVLTLMSYMAVLSAALAIRNRSHIRMTAFDGRLPKGLVKTLDILNDLFVMVLAVVMVVIGWQYAISIGAVGTYTSMPWLSRFWMYFPIPVAGIAMFVFELELLYNHVKGICLKEGDK